MSELRHDSQKTLRPVLFVLGTFLTILGVAMLIPSLVDWVKDDPDWMSFLVSGVMHFNGSVALGAF